MYPPGSLFKKLVATDDDLAGVADMHVLGIVSHANSFSLSAIVALPDRGSPWALEWILSFLTNYDTFINKYLAAVYEWKESTF